MDELAKDVDMGDREEDQGLHFGILTLERPVRK